MPCHSVHDLQGIDEAIAQLGGKLYPKTAPEGDFCIDICSPQRYLRGVRINVTK